MAPLHGVSIAHHIYISIDILLNPIFAAIFCLLITVSCIAHCHGAGAATPIKKGAPLRITKPQPFSSTTAAPPTTSVDSTSTTGELLSPLIYSTTEGTASSVGVSASASSITTADDGSSTTAAGSLVPEICITGLQLTLTNAAGEQVVRRQPELVQIIEGDVMLSVLTSDPVSAMFVINRVNQANLISADFEVGE